jgi:hypothetical protein
MNESNTVKFWGTLDTSARTIEDIPEGFRSLYDQGEHRMRPEDVKRMKKYLTRLSVAEKKIKETLRLFEKLNN